MRQRKKLMRPLFALGSAGLLALALSGCGGSSSSSSSSSSSGSTGATTLAAHYIFTDLGSVGTGGTLPTGINNAGVITGVFSSSGSAATQSFRHTGASPATLSDVLTLPASVLHANGSVQATSINAASTVAGTFDSNYSNTGNVAAIQDAFVYDTAFHDLGALPPGSFTGRSIAVAAAINDSGTVAGSDNFEDAGQVHAFRHTGTGPLTAADDLGSFGSYTSLIPSAINVAGTIAGNAMASSAGAGGNQAQHAFVYDSAFHDLGVLPGSITSEATGINASGVVIGVSGAHSFRHSGTGPLTAADDLGTGFVAEAINANGDVVGLVNVTASIAKVGGTVQSLAPLVTNLPSGFGLQNATAINDAGQIVGYTRNNGVAEAWLLTPAP